MAKQRFTAEEIIHKLREADVLIGQGKSIGDACKQLGVTDKPNATAAGGGLGAFEALLLRAPHLPRVGHREIEHPLSAATQKRRGAATGIDHPSGLAVRAVRLSDDHRAAGPGGP